MAKNPYLDFYNQDSEQTLISDLNREVIEAVGQTVFYLPRTHNALNRIVGEDTQSSFESAFELEAYVAPYRSFGDNEDFIDVGNILEIRDTGVLEISRAAFSERVAPTRTRPMKGDLIYVPFGKHNNLFEISRVEDEIPFYQLGDLYQWAVGIRMFEYSSEKIRTGIPAIDSIENRYVSSRLFTIGAGTGTYIENEVVYQGVDLATATFSAEVLSIEGNTLTLKFTKGTPQIDVALIGSTSSSNYILSSYEQVDASNNFPLDDNEYFESESDDIVLWDSNNPFGSE